MIIKYKTKNYELLILMYILLASILLVMPLFFKDGNYNIMIILPMIILALYNIFNLWYHLTTPLFYEDNEIIKIDRGILKKTIIEKKKIEKVELVKSYNDIICLQIYVKNNDNDREKIEIVSNKNNELYLEKIFEYLKEIKIF